jgi:hypothetical protein
LVSERAAWYQVGLLQFNRKGVTRMRDNPLTHQDFGIDRPLPWPGANPAGVSEPVVKTPDRARRRAARARNEEGAYLNGRQPTSNNALLEWSSLLELSSGVDEDARRASAVNAGADAPQAGRRGVGLDHRLL